MAPKLVSAILCRNEADKYLERVIRRCMEYSDEVLVLDDGSTDGSDRLAWRLGCGVRKRPEPGMWGNEAPARAELWDWAAEVAGDGWVIITDADMLLHGDPRPLMLTKVHNAWAFPLWDLWNDERYYRRDGYWQGHKHPRPWMFKPSAMQGLAPEWNPRGLHTGHFPLNFPIECGVPNGIVLSEGCILDFGWMHLSYVDAANRGIKCQQYLEKAHLLTPFELEHARSVGD